MQILTLCRVIHTMHLQRIIKGKLTLYMDIWQCTCTSEIADKLNFTKYNKELEM